MITTSSATNPALAVHRSRKMIPDFRLHRPRTVGEAVAMQAEAGDAAVFMAGGIDLINRMKFGERVSDVIYLGGVAGLDTIVETEGELRLGSLVTHYGLETSALVRAHFPEFVETWQDVANIRIRYKGTIGGNIMAADPNYDFPLAAMAAGAQLHFLGPDNAARTLAAIDWSGAGSPGLLTAITIPSAASRFLLFDRSLRPALTLALGLDLEQGKVTFGRVAIGCAFATPTAVRLPLDEPLPLRILAQRAALVAHDVAASVPEPLNDSVAGSRYRRRMIEVLLRRKLSALA